MALIVWANSVNNLSMEYAIAAAVTALFILIYIFGKQKSREGFTQTFDDEQYKLFCNSFAKDLPFPKNGGKGVNVSEYKKKINKCVRQLKKPQDEEIFAVVKALLDEENKTITLLLKKDYAPLQDLPHISASPRTVLCADAMLSHSKYIFNDDRVATIVCEVNKVRTLTFSEIQHFEDSFNVVLLEKLSFLCERISALLKLKAYSAKISQKPKAYDESKILKRLKKNAIFLKYCAEELEYDQANFNKIYDKLIEDIRFYLGNVLDSLSSVKSYSFSKFYRPLEILSEFENFRVASSVCKQHFLEALQELSTEENIDEYAYTLRLKKYMQRGQMPPANAYKFPLPNKKLVAFRSNDDMLQLALTLSSPAYMSMIFGEKKKKRKSIIKNTKIKNTFAPYYETYTAKFGISVTNDKLLLNPRFPTSIQYVSLILEHKGVFHTIEIIGGEENLLEVNGTEMHGIADITLGDIPLVVKCVVPFEREAKSVFFQS